MRTITDIGYLGCRKQLNSESINRSSLQALRRGVTIACIDDAVNIGNLLDSLHRALKHSLPLATVVGVGVEDAYSALYFTAATGDA